ncbi:MAG: RtcB family protein [Opitutales bacterium]|nr:RtcB family protein [Opitutales bacterium]MCH8539918.1 RtcB family protein [Opitutales bacterium]
MKTKHLKYHGIPEEYNEVATEACKAWTAAGKDDRELGLLLKALAKDAKPFLNHPQLGPLATAMLEKQTQIEKAMAVYQPKPWQQWGEDIEPTSIEQMKNAVKLPVAVRGALMPDAHLGYGLPIGGVLATRQAVIPYAVGVDIACRMKMTVLDMPTSALAKKEKKLAQAIHEETRFGMGARFENKREHPVMDKDWLVSPVTQRLKDKAWAQLGTSGSGNHFVEFGTLTLETPDLGLDAGTYLALLSHSGSRGTGAQVAAHYSRLAMDSHPELPKPLRHLAWLDLNTEAGQEYWAAMSLMGNYAAANHACIHRAIASHLGVEVLLDLENHHNYAWKEWHDGEEVIVHRKGATPAGEGVLGIIPGSMGDPGFIVRGKGHNASLHSASHGAGRRMSRTAANKKFKNLNPETELQKRGVTLLSAGWDELPMCYKDIREVMADQADLVETVARFDPKLVKMAPAGEKPED